MIEDEKKSGLDPVIIFILISLLLHGLLFYFIPNLPKPKKKEEKPISVKLIEEPVKGEKKLPKKPHALGKENITVKKETRPEDKPKIKGEKQIARRLTPPPLPAQRPEIKRPVVKVVPPPKKAPPKPKKKAAKSPKQKVPAIKPPKAPKKSRTPPKKILATPKKKRVKIAEAKPKQKKHTSFPPTEKPLFQQPSGPAPKTTQKSTRLPSSGRPGAPLVKKAPPLPAPKSLFPSPETLNQIERKFSHTYPKDIEKGNTISLNTKSYKYISYFTHIKRKIELVWEYPRTAAELGQEGRLTLRFTILKDGRLYGVKLIQSSGYHLLDDEAVRAVKEAAPFNPIPDRLHKDHLNILASFTYTLGFKFVY